jgi:hypothetical protein
MPASWLEIIWLSMANAAIAFTVTEMRLFRSVREWMKAKHDWLGELWMGYVDAPRCRKTLV